MKQQGLSFEMYSSDWNGYCPAGCISNGNDPENGQWTIFCWVRSLWPYSVGPLSERPFNPYSSPILKTVFYCPSDPVLTGTVTAGGGSGTYERYGLNSNIFTAQTRLTTVNATTLLPTPYPSLYAKCPSQNVLVCEVFRSEAGWPWAFYPQGSGGYGLISHSLGGNFLFMDKHVESRKYPGGIPAYYVGWPEDVPDWNRFWFGGR